MAATSTASSTAESRAGSPLATATSAATSTGGLTAGSPLAPAASTAAGRWPHRAVRAAGLSLGCAVQLLAACSGGGDAGPEAGPAVTTAPGAGATGDGTGPAAATAFVGPDADDFNRRLEPEAGLVDLQPVLILGVVADGRAGVMVSFEMESHHCHGIQATVEETATEVVLDLQTGRRAGVSPAACTYGVYPYTIALELDGPLGDRAVTTATDRAGAPAPAAGAGAGTATKATGPDPRLDPAQVDPLDVTPDEVGRYTGRPVEDGVEWALTHDRRWRILSYDGEPVDPGGPDDPARLSLTVVADVIVAYEWS